MADLDVTIPVDRALLENACHELREWKVKKGGDDQVVLNLEALLASPPPDKDRIAASSERGDKL